MIFAMNKNKDGFTIIELSVTIAIVAIILGVVLMGVSNIHKTDLSTSASKIQSAIIYLYNLSAINNRNYRLVLDIDNNSFWGEMLQGETPCERYLLPSEEEKKWSLKKIIKKPQEEKQNEEENEEGKGSFSVIKDNLLTKKELPAKVKFSAIMTTHYKEPVKEGVAEVNFFPDGYVEKAYVYLAYEDEIYTVETLPLMGTAKVHPEEIDINDFFAQ